MSNNYIYHYSTELFDSIKSLALQGKKSDYGEDYDKSFSAFLTTVNKKDLGLLKKTGFKVYNVDNLYEYKINITDNGYMFYDGKIRLTSTPEQIKYDNKNWDKFLKLTKDKSFSVFIKEKEKYKKERSTYLKSLGVYEFTVEDYVKSEYINNIISDYPKYIKQNIYEGNKNQYASVIPHIHTSIVGELVPEKITKIYF